MEWWNSIFERREIWTILGILLGFSLGELSRMIREWIRRHRLKVALFDELDTNFHLMHQKQDILRQMTQALQNNTILPGTSVHSASTIYRSHVAEIGVYLKPVYRDNMHIIYERLRVSDDFMDRFKADFEKDLQLQVMKNPWQTYITFLTEIQNTMEEVKGLISAVRSKNPTDLLYRHSKNSK